MTTPQIVYCAEARCVHFRGPVGPLEDPVFVCKAFPAGIPAKVLAGRDEHLRPIAGDGGIVFQPPLANSKREG